MPENTFLSFLAPPFPYFIEGNFTKYKKGQRHPNRYNLEYFDVIIIKEGTLYLGEADQEWQLKPGEALILEPDKHHFPIEACNEDTSFYWFHFKTQNKWCVQKKHSKLEPDEPIPTLHFYSKTNTIHLPKFQKLVNPEELYKILNALLESTEKDRSLAFWETQQIFMQILQSIEYDDDNQSHSLQLAEQIEIYLKQNYTEVITNKSLSAHFHIHENYLARCMKKVFRCTPLEYLENYRIGQGRLLLIKTDLPLKIISEEIGFSQPSYFSQRFKNKFGVSPNKYRKQFLEHEPTNR